MNVRLTLMEELLGTSSANPDLVREFIASRRPEGIDEAEIESLPDVDEEMQRWTTVFCRNAEGRPILWDYQIKGFFKDACGALRRGDNTLSAKLKAYKKEIDGLIFVAPRQIVAHLPEGGVVGFCERPLRAQTAQGERVSLARSESLPAGTVLEFEILLLSDKLAEFVDEWIE